MKRPKTARARETTVTEDMLLTQALALRTRGMLVTEIADELQADVSHVRRLLTNAGQLAMQEARDAAVHTLASGAIAAAATLVGYATKDTDPESLDAARFRAEQAGELLDRVGLGTKAAVRVHVGDVHNDNRSVVLERIRTKVAKLREEGVEVDAPKEVA